MPVYGGATGDTSGICPYARLKNSQGEEGIVVPMYLPVATMQRLEEEIWRMTQQPVKNWSQLKLSLGSMWLDTFNGNAQNYSGS